MKELQGACHIWELCSAMDTGIIDQKHVVIYDFWHNFGMLLKSLFSKEWKQLLLALELADCLLLFYGRLHHPVYTDCKVLHFFDLVHTQFFDDRWNAVCILVKPVVAKPRRELYSEKSIVESFFPIF